ncbi:helix-turn-helix domain-containing protein [Amycolatopsis keratiniphila]|uniref:Uncharacterized protein n=1 Tax=Amycolatopsis keratiniphila subsp. keratiniphila TaxID=227715 RepID=A0A1W2M2W4_9PSEU|nr:hypothetical protein [Amycolatopsis keratiniphila]ONF74358.1 hypothetical protein AVR91_0203440 [Amycolatopsis keratiniphila subsp. keratiniphila]
MSATSSPLTALQRQLAHPKSSARFDTALHSWSAQDPALADAGTHERLSEVLSSRHYARHDEVLYALLQRAALAGGEGIVAGEVVLNAMLPAVPGIVGRVIRASRAAIGTFGARRGVTGAGVSANESNADVQAAVIGHLWEQIRCYPLRRRHHVAANLVFDTQRAALRALGVDITQAAAEVVAMDDVAGRQPLAETPAEKDASEELLELLSWAVEQSWLDEQEAAILTARYFGEQMGRDGVATDRQLGTLFGVSQPTATRRRNRALDALAEAGRQWQRSGLG